MRHKHLVAAAATAGLLAIGPLSGFADAATASGVGTASVSSTVLGVQLGTNGDLLSIRVLGDDGTATIDPGKGTPVSSETLSPLTITSKAVPALNVSVPSVGTSSTGAEDKKSVQPDLPDLPAFTGDLNAALSSIVDAAGAKSGLNAGLANLSVAGGLLSIPSATASTTSSAIKTDATGNRSLEIPSIEVLNLGAVLNALGTSLSALPVSDLLGLLSGLGVPVPNVSDPAAAITTLNSAIDLLQAQTGTITSALCSQLDGVLGPLATTVTNVVPTTVPAVPLPTPSDPLGGLLGAAGVTCDTTQTVNQVLDQVQATLADLLSSILNLLAGTPLLSVKDVKIGLIAKAADTVQSSVADVTASIGSVNVGNLAVPGVSGLDLADAASVINGATEAIQSAVGGVLSQVNAALANIVDVDVLKITKGVTTANGYNNAASTITALTATITPPVDLGSLLGAAAVGDSTPVSSVLGTLGASVPPVATLMTQLEAALGGVQALSGPSVITAGTLSANGTFKAVSGATSTTPGGQLPRTGRNAALPAMIAVTLAALAVTIRRVLRVVNA